MMLMMNTSTAEKRLPHMTGTKKLPAKPYSSPPKLLSAMLRVADAKYVVSGIHT